MMRFHYSSYILLNWYESFSIYTYFQAWKGGGVGVVAGEEEGEQEVGWSVSKDASIWRIGAQNHCSCILVSSLWGGEVGVGVRGGKTIFTYANMGRYISRFGEVKFHPTYHQQIFSQVLLEITTTKNHHSYITLSWTSFVFTIFWVKMRILAWYFNHFSLNWWKKHEMK